MDERGSGGLAIRLPRLERRPSVSDEVARRLLDFLLSGEIAKGAKIPSERQLAEALGVARSAIRDALKPLAMMGLLEVRVGDGTYLASSESDLLPEAIEWALLLGSHRTRELVEARRHVEVVLAGLAAQRGGAAAVADLETLVARMDAARDAAEFTSADKEFHLRIAAAAENSVLAAVLANVRSLLHVWILRVTEEVGETRHSRREHREILEAIRSRRPDLAERAMAAHLDAATDRLQRALAALEGR